jgi:hypothetical protein
MGRSGEVLTVKLGGRAIHVMQPPQPERPAFIREEFALAFEIIPQVETHSRILSISLNMYKAPVSRKQFVAVIQ